MISIAWGDGCFRLTGDCAVAANAGPRLLCRLKPDASKIPVLTVAAAFADTTAVGEPGVILLSRADDRSSPLTGNFRLGGTAADGIDYTMLTDARRMPAGKSTMQRTISQ